MSRNRVLPRRATAPEAEALAAFHRWADTRRRRSWHVAFFVRYGLGCLLLWISSGCIALARIVAPVP